jgi:Co/Zn/Cd efflux system component
MNNKIFIQYINMLFKINDKVRTLIISCIIFTFIYLLLDDSHFSGLNKIQETIKQELLKKEVEPEVEKVITESFWNWNKQQTSLDKRIEEKQKDVAIEEKTEDVKQEVKEMELKPEQITPSIFQQSFNRLYFSISTGCLLGFGDIYPITNISKCFSILQALFTVSLILS